MVLHPRAIDEIRQFSIATRQCLDSVLQIYLSASHENQAMIALLGHHLVVAKHLDLWFALDINKVDRLREQSYYRDIFARDPY